MRWRDNGRERRGSADTAAKRRAADYFWALVGVQTVIIRLYALQLYDMSYNWGIFLTRGRTRTQYSTVCRRPSLPRASHWSDPADVAMQSATIQQPGPLTKCARVSHKRILTVSGHMRSSYMTCHITGRFSLPEGARDRSFQLSADDQVARGHLIGPILQMWQRSQQQCSDLAS